jgi:hypothetical protein
VGIGPYAVIYNLKDIVAWILDHTEYILGTGDICRNVLSLLRPDSPWELIA